MSISHLSDVWPVGQTISGQDKSIISYYQQESCPFGGMILNMLRLLMIIVVTLINLQMIHLPNK